MHAQLLRRRDRAMQADLIGLRRRVDLVGKPDFRHHKTVFAREFAPHLGDPVGDFGVLRQQRRRQFLREAEFDFDRLQLFLDRGARLEVVKDAGHLIALERPDETAELLQPWLERVSA